MYLICYGDVVEAEPPVPLAEVGTRDVDPVLVGIHAGLAKVVPLRRDKVALAKDLVTWGEE